VFWVISVYFNIRNTLLKYGTFLLGHPVYKGKHNRSVMVTVQGPRPPPPTTTTTTTTIRYGKTSQAISTTQRIQGTAISWQDHSTCILGFRLIFFHMVKQLDSITVFYYTVMHIKWSEETTW
jgi:hypothetical protein